MTSVFAGTVAFSGTVAAVANESISPSSSDAGTSQTYTIEADAGVNDDLQSIEVDWGGGTTNLGDVSASDVTLDVGSNSDVGVSTSASGDTLTVTLDSATTVSNGDTITLDVTVDNTDTVGTYTANVDYNYAGTTESVSLDYDIVNNNRERLDEADEPLVSGEVFWQGQDLFLKVPGEGGEVYTLRTEDGDFISDLSLDENGEAVIDTKEADEGMDGSYVVQEGNDYIQFDSQGVASGRTSNAEDASFEIQDQDLSASFEEATVEDGTATLQLDSNRGGYLLNITSSELEAEELISIFETSEDLSPTEIDDDEIQVRISSTNFNTELNFSAVDANNYTFQFAVADTNVVDSASINRIEGEDADASFRDGNTFEVGEGDVAVLPIEMQETSRVTVYLGSNEKGFVERVTLRDDNDDGQVGLRVNTYLAGRDISEPLDAYETVDDDDDIIGSEFTRYSDPISDPPLDATFYDLNLTVGDSEKAVGTLSLTDRQTSGINALTSPGNQFEEAENANELAELQSNGLLTRQNQIASGDTLTFEIDSTSILGALETARDGGDSYEQAFVDMIYGEGIISGGEFAFSVQQESAAANQGPKWFDLDETRSAGAMNVIPDRENGSLFVEFDTSNVETVRADDIQEAESSDGSMGLSTGESYTANFTIGEASGMVDEKAVIERDVDIVERQVDFDVADSGRLEVYPAPGQLVSGNTTVAPGTVLNIRLRRTGTRGSFLKTPTPTVESDGSFDATVDFSDSPGNVTFDIEIRGIETEVQGYVQPRRTASANISDQVIPTGGSVLIEDVELSEGGFIALHRDSPTGEVVGSSGYIAPGNQTDVRIPLNVAGSSVTLAAVPHLDDDGNEEFSAAFDPPYERNGSVVSYEAQMTILTPTPTPNTETPTPEPVTLTTTRYPTKTETPTPTATLTPINTTENDEETTTTSGPGFTLGLALLALAGAALLAVRRRD